MREIKFRGKRLDNGEWVYGNLVQSEFGSWIVLSGYSYRHDIPQQEFIQVDPSTIGQFTGLHDKNWREIYEGDIIKSEWSNTRSEIKFGLYNTDSDYEPQKSIGFYFGRKYGSYCPFGLDIDGKTSKYEIIGNIHDNPELLGGASNV